MTARSRSAAVLVAVLVALSTVVATGAVVGAQSGAGNATGTNATNATTETGVDLPAADDIYLKDNGDAVLAYESPANGTQARYGLNVSKSLFHALVVTDLNDTSSVMGNATAILTRDHFTGNGNLSVPRPESLSNLSVNVTGKQTNENARYDITASGTVVGMNNSIAALVQSVQVAGNVTTTGSMFDANVEAHVRLLGPLGQPQHQEYHLSEQNGAYTLNASQNQTVFTAAAPRWNTRERAKQTLKARYVAIARSLGGTADLTLESYSFTNETDSPRIDIEYSVTYNGIESGIANRLMATLTTSENINLTQSEARNITQRLKKLSIEELSVKYDQRGGSIDAVMHVDLRNYDEVVFAALDVAEAIDTQSVSTTTVGGMSGTNAGVMGMNATAFDAQIEQIRDRFEARQAANLTSRITFAANLTSETRGSLSFGLESHYRTENWGQYVKELQKRGIEINDLRYELHAATEGERVVVSAAVEVSGKNLLKRATNRLLNSSGGGAANTQKYVTAFREAGFRKARMDVSLHGGQVRVETGAAFENMTALRDAVAVMGQGQTFEGIVGRTEGDTVTSYVRIDGTVSADATESQVRELAFVGDDTTIHMPGSWDRTFPSTNTTLATAYLEHGMTNVSMSTTTSATDDGDGATSTSTETTTEEATETETQMATSTTSTPDDTTTSTEATSTGATSNETSMGGDVSGDSGTTGPGFGIVVAVIALLAAALVAVRRQ